MGGLLGCTARRKERQSCRIHRPVAPPSPAHDLSQPKQAGLLEAMWTQQIFLKILQISLRFLICVAKDYLSGYALRRSSGVQVPRRTR